MRTRTVLIPLAAAFSLAASVPGAPRFYALHDSVTLHSAEAIAPAVERVSDFASRMGEGCDAAVFPFVYGSGFLRYNARGLDLDAGVLVDLGSAADEKTAAGKIDAFLSRALETARAAKEPGFMFLDGLDPASEEGRAFVSALPDDLSRSRSLSASSADPYWYLVPLSAPSGLLVPNRLFRNTLPLGGNVKYAFLSDAVRYTPLEDPGVKQVTIQVFFVADIAGQQWVMSPTYRKGYRVMVPQVAAFNSLFTDSRGVQIMESLMAPYPPELVGFECLTQMYGGMLGAYASGDKMKFLKRAHQVFDLIEERFAPGDRALFAGLLKKYLSNPDFADAACLYEAAAVAKAYVEKCPAPAPLDGAFTRRFRLMGRTLPRLAAAFPRARGSLSRYRKNNDAVVRMMERRGAEGAGAIVGRLDEAVGIGREIERTLIEDVDMDVLLSMVAATLAADGVSQSVALVTGGKFPVTPALKPRRL